MALYRNNWLFQGALAAGLAYQMRLLGMEALPSYVFGPIAALFCWSLGYLIGEITSRKRK